MKLNELFENHGHGYYVKDGKDKVWTPSKAKADKIKKKKCKSKIKIEKDNG